MIRDIMSVKVACSVGVSDEVSEKWPIQVHRLNNYQRALNNDFMKLNESTTSILPGLLPRHEKFLGIFDGIVTPHEST